MRASRPVTRPFTVSGGFARGVPADVLGGRLAVARGCPGCRRSTATSGSRVDPVLIGPQVRCGGDGFGGQARGSGCSVIGGTSGWRCGPGAGRVVGNPSQAGEGLGD